jgi:Ca2+-binding RTX toxin-like protein
MPVVTSLPTLLNAADQPVSVTANHFGSNFLFGKDDPTEGSFYDVVNDAVNAQTLRFPGGTVTENDFDIKSTADLAVLTQFLDFCASNGQNAMIVLPTYRFFVDGTDANTSPISSVAESDIQTFVDFVLAEAAAKGVTIQGFEIGNEFYQFDWTDAEFAELQAQFSEWVSDAIDESNAAVDVYIQAGQTLGENETFLEAFRANENSDPDLSDVDGIITHLYYGATGQDLSRIGLVKNRTDILEAVWGDYNLDTVVTEWNVSEAVEEQPEDTFIYTGKSAVYGFARLAALTRGFGDIIGYGVDTAMFWSTIAGGPYGRATLAKQAGDTLPTDYGSLILPTGYWYQLMATTLIDTELVSNHGYDAAFLDGNGDFAGYSHTFQGTGAKNNDYHVVYASGIYDQLDLDLDISSLISAGSYVYATVIRNEGTTALSNSDSADDILAANLINANAKASIEVITNLTSDVDITLESYEFVEINVVTGHGLNLNTDMFNDVEDNLTLTNHNDVVSTHGGKDTVRANGGNDRIELGAGNDVGYGGDGADTLFGEDNNDCLYGDVGNDNLFGNGGNDRLYGGSGNDILLGGSGADIIDGGEGIDRAQYHTANAGVLVALENQGANQGDAAGDQYNLIENLFGSSHNDTLRGDGGDNDIWGYFGNDVIYGRAGNDTLRGQVGNDVLFGGEGHDALHGDEGNDILAGDAGNDSLYGGAGDDILRGGDGADSLNGGEGTDSARYILADSAVSADLTNQDNNSGDAAGDQYYSIENLFGSVHNDSLRGDDLNNKITGFNGNDVVHAEGGSDSVLGGLGNDELHGENGADTLWGEDGIDTLFGGAGSDGLFGGVGDDILNGGVGADTIHGGEGTDRAQYSGAEFAVLVDLDDQSINVGDAAGDQFFLIENLFGSGHNDSLRGDSADNYIWGYNGDDEVYARDGNDTLLGQNGDDNLHGQNGVDALYGDAGSDTLFGEAGNDRLYGGAGNDILLGGLGNDLLEGGAGGDRFIFSGQFGQDQIADFTLAETGEVIDLSLNSSITGFSDLVLTQNGLHTLIDIGNGNTIQLNNIVHSQLSSGDFDFA